MTQLHKDNNGAGIKCKSCSSEEMNEPVKSHDHILDERIAHVEACLFASTQNYM